MDAPHHRPRRRRPPTRGLLFGAPLDRVPAAAEPGPAVAPPPRPDPVPVALIGASTPVAPPPVTAFGAMAATWPLVDRPAPEARPLDQSDRRPWPGRAAPSERRWGGLSAEEWTRLIGT